ncbi:MAG: DUF6448 family protein [Ignavibacteriales bacterium]|nr:DUF6448 family protein [Ignavibacteriales bacterium]
MKSKIMFIGILVLLTILLFQNKVRAHCDTMDGPVVKAAKLALEKSDVTPVLKWIKKEYEDEVRSAFKKTLQVRTKGQEAQELAEKYFFETLVRLHRASEGEPYTGLKPSGTPIEPPVAAADNALKTGDVKELSNLLSVIIEEGIAIRFKHVLEAKKDADKSVDAGREFVEAYVEFVHYAERLHQAAESNAHHNESLDKHDVH